MSGSESLVVDFFMSDLWVSSISVLGTDPQVQGKLEGGDDFFGVPGGLYFGEYFGHDSIFVDDERGSFDAHIFFAVHGFFDPHAAGFGECVICIC